MSYALSELSDGDVIDCCVVFVSKRTQQVNDKKVAVLTLELCGSESCRLVLGPRNISLSYGWATGDTIELRSVLVAEATPQSATDQTCLLCGGELRRREATSLSPVSETVATTVAQLDTERCLVAVPGTVIASGCGLEKPLRASTANTPDWLTPLAECRDCGRTLGTSQYH